MIERDVRKLRSAGLFETRAIFNPDGRMKQGQSVTMRPSRNHKKTAVGSSEALLYPAYAPRGWQAPARGASGWLIPSVMGILGASWYLITLPFRVLYWVISLLGRLAGLVVGFSLMVVGMALWAGPLFIIGIPVFIIGLLLTLRCLG
jgi:hypothetical protein